MMDGRKIEDRCDSFSPIASNRSAYTINAQCKEILAEPNRCLGQGFAKLRVNDGLTNKKLDRGELSGESGLNLAPGLDLPKLTVSGSTTMESGSGWIKEVVSKDDQDELVESIMVDEWYGDLVMQPTPPSGEF